MSNYFLYPSEAAARAALEKWLSENRPDLDVEVQGPVPVRRGCLSPANRLAELPERGSGIDRRMARALAPDAFQAPEGASSFRGLKARAWGLFDPDRPASGTTSFIFAAAWPAETA